MAKFYIDLMEYYLKQNNIAQADKFENSAVMFLKKLATSRAPQDEEKRVVFTVKQKMLIAKAIYQAKQKNIDKLKKLSEEITSLYEKTAALKCGADRQLKNQTCNYYIERMRIALSAEDIHIFQDFKNKTRQLIPQKNKHKTDFFDEIVGLRFDILQAKYYLGQRNESKVTEIIDRQISPRWNLIQAISNGEDSSLKAEMLNFYTNLMFHYDMQGLRQGDHEGHRKA